MHSLDTLFGLHDLQNAWSYTVHWCVFSLMCLLTESDVMQLNSSFYVYIKVCETLDCTFNSVAETLITITHSPCSIVQCWFVHLTVNCSRQLGRINLKLKSTKPNCLDAKMWWIKCAWNDTMDWIQNVESEICEVKMQMLMIRLVEKLTREILGWVCYLYCISLCAAHNSMYAAHSRTQLWWDWKLK